MCFRLYTECMENLDLDLSLVLFDLSFFYFIMLLFVGSVFDYKIVGLGCKE